MADATKNKARDHQLYFIGAFLQAKMKNRVFVKLDSRYKEYFTEYANYFGRTLRLLKSMFVMTNTGKLFDDELTEWFVNLTLSTYHPVHPCTPTKSSAHAYTQN